MAEWAEHSHVGKKELTRGVARSATERGRERGRRELLTRGTELSGRGGAHKQAGVYLLASWAGLSGETGWRAGEKKERVGCLWGRERVGRREGLGCWFGLGKRKVGHGPLRVLVG